jgi:YVTN family beta-propeller protein
MKFRLLGPVEVEDRGRLLVLGSAKQRALLAILLVHANEVVSRDRLIDELWGEQPPASAPHSLDVYVSRLRKTLQPDSGERLLLTRPGGYLLRLEQDQLDVTCFEQLVQDGRRALAAGNYERAAERLVEALALWRGPALGDLAYEPFARPEIERLEEQRLAAFEEKIEAELALGRHGALIGELEAVSRTHPLREPLHRQLMLALYRSGRQADALETSRALRRHLRDELGLDPSPALQRLEQAILRQDPTLELSTRPLAREEGQRPVETTSSRRPLPSINPWRPAIVAVGIGGLLLAAVAGAIVLFTGGSGRALGAVDANAVGILDPRTGKIKGEVLLKTAPAQIAAGARSIWAVSPNNQSVSRIDPETGNVVQRIDVGGGPSGIAYSRAGGAVWVAETLDGRVARIDPGTNQVVDRIAVGNVPVAVAAGFGSIWITNLGDQSVTRLDAITGNPLRIIPTGAVGRGIAVGGAAVWVSDDAAGSVSRIDPNTNRVTDRISVGNGATALAYGAHALWVTNRLDGTVSRIDPATNVATTLRVGGSPEAIAVTGNGVWVSDETGGRLIRIDPRRNSVVATVETSNRPRGIAFAAGRMWLAVQAAGAHRGGTFRVVSTGNFEIDPARAYSTETVGVLTTTNDGLTAFKRVGGEEGNELVPDLATALPKPGDGGRTYVYKLRRGIRYSTGRMVHPADIRYALERDFALQSPGIGLYEGVRGAASCVQEPAHCDLNKGVVADTRANTVTFHLVAPDPEFPAKLALPFAAAVPVGTPKRDMIVPATGPYLIANYAPKRQLELQRNPRFHEWSKTAQPDGYPDEILWKFIVSDDRKVTAVERGEADWLADIVPSDRLREIQTQYASQLHTSPQYATQYLFLNTRVPPFDDIRVRQALNYAIDRRAVARLLGGPTSTQPTCQVLPPSFPGYRRYCPYTRNPRADGVWRAPDIDKAKRLIAASHTRGAQVKVWVFDAEPWAGIARYTASLLRRLGYRTSVMKVGPTTYTQTVGDSGTRAQIGVAAWGADYPRASNFFKPNFTCRSFQRQSRSNLNLAQFCSRKIDAEIANAQAKQFANPEVASDNWATVDHNVVDQAPWVPLVTPISVNFFSKRTGNYQVSPQRNVLLGQLWVR